MLVLGFGLVWGAQQVQAGEGSLAGLPVALFSALAAVGLWIAFHLALRWRGMRGEQVFLPVIVLIFSLGLIVIFRLRGEAGAWQQITRGLLPGLLIGGAFALRPGWVDWMRQRAVPISILGLMLALATAAFGVQDESGARLSLKLGPLPAIQTSEWIKLALLIFLAWFVDREGEVVEGRARVFLGRLRIPPVRYFIPGALFVGVATLALVAMSDYGAVLILGTLFVAMLYAGFQTRLFGTIAVIGLALAVLVGVALALTWDVPAVIQTRFLAFLNPWSTAEVVIDGRPTGLTISEGPGYQIQQAVYAAASGGLTGTGLGYGHPEFIPLAASDFIFAALLEEMGAIVGIALLALYAILLLRILRIAVLLPREQVFERLLLVGIGVHFFTQVFVMVGGTLNLIPLTGVTIPFLSLGGSALLTNLFEAGLVLALAQRLEASPL